VVDDGSRTPLDTGGGTVPAGTAGRRLLTGEAADPRWQASLHGDPLPPSTVGWQQAFVLPAQGGSVSWALHTSWHWLLLAQLAALLVAGVLAAPAIRRPEVRDPTKSARRAAIGTEVAE
jgi:hypothetical protein